MKDIFLCRALGWNVASQINYLKPPLIKTINMEIFVLIKNIPLFNHIKEKVIQNVIYFPISNSLKRTVKMFFLAESHIIVNSYLWEKIHLIYSIAHILTQSELLCSYFN